MTRRDVLLAIQHCETIASSLEDLTGLGRTDTRRRDSVSRVLGRLTNPILEELDRKGRYLAVPDGYPTRTPGAGDTVRGGSELTSVEAAVAWLTGDVDHVVRHRVVWEGPRKVSDGVGESVCKIFDGLERMATLANALGSVPTRESLRPMAGIASSVEKALDLVFNVQDKARGRVSSLSGPCQCCGRDVAGTEKDRMRSGMCHADYTAWCRDGRPERAPWMEQRKQELDDRKGAA